MSTMSYKKGSSTVQMTYQISGFSSDYRSSDKATTLSTTANLSKAVVERAAARGKPPEHSPCQALQQMSSGWSTGDKSHFYSDYKMTGGDTGCQAADQNNTTTSLNNILKSILVNLTAARLSK